ncbi:hypothetical protein [Spirosoma fluminis]
METIYEWLLHNTEDEGNYFTILNTKRHTQASESEYLDVMARSKDFTVVNLLIFPQQAADSAIDPTWLQGRTVADQYGFAAEQDVITFLRNGQTPNSAGDTSGIGIAVLQPVGDTGTLTFPPEQ